MAQQLSCFGLNADVKKMTKEFMAMQREIAELVTKAEKNRDNYTSTQRYCILLDDIIINYVFKEGDESRYTNPLTSYDLLTKSIVKTSL